MLITRVQKFGKTLSYYRILVGLEFCAFRTGDVPVLSVAWIFLRAFLSASLYVWIFLQHFCFGATSFGSQTAYAKHAGADAVTGLPAPEPPRRNG